MTASQSQPSSDLYSASQTGIWQYKTGCDGYCSPELNDKEKLCTEKCQYHWLLENSKAVVKWVADRRAGPILSTCKENEKQRSVAISQIPPNPRANSISAEISESSKKRQASRRPKTPARKTITLLLGSSIGRQRNDSPVRDPRSNLRPKAHR
ncbi:hypothetical protein L484_023172 [Morus notabilis]|uniref:Uncharacterized protein n=1 Tax=Morus notabilis TaxID=981085 RepID=W9RYP1_9ROSA|nr:hypothetical protein L484_023172 [Morus notabilis]